MKKIVSVFCILSAIAVCIPALAIEKVESPSLNLAAYFDVQEGRPVYWLLHKGDTVIRPSHLGIALRGEKNRSDFYEFEEEAKKSPITNDQSPMTEGLMNGFVMTGSERYIRDSWWEPVWGEERRIHDSYHEMLITLKQPEKDRYIQIQFRLYDDGLGISSRSSVTSTTSLSKRSIPSSPCRVTLLPIGSRATTIRRSMNIRAAN